MASRLKSRYEEEIRPALIERFGYSTPMQAPTIRKITLNMGVGDAKQDSKVLEAATEQLATIAGQRPSVRRARKSIAAFKLREGMPVGVSVTLRGERSYEFLDRLMSVAIPRIRDFRGMNPRSFDGRGNYSMGVREQIIFPEIDYDAIDQTRGLDITITTSAATDQEAFALLEAFGFPFARDEAGDAALRQSVADEDAAAANGAAVIVEEPAAEAEVAIEEEPAGEVAAGEEPAGEVAAEEEPAGEVAAEEEPAGEVAVEEEPAGEVAVEEEPAGEVAVEEEPAGEVAVEEEPAGEVAVEEEPAGEVAVEEEPAGEVAVEEEPSPVEEPVGEQATEVEPAAEAEAQEPSASGGENDDAGDVARQSDDQEH